MSRSLIVKRSGQGISIQDLGRPGYLTYGLSRGGAADRLALLEGAALLKQDPGLAAIEMVGIGGVFEVTEDTRIALTGAPMRATLDGAPLAWNASHLLPAGAALAIGAATEGVYGYLSLGGGLASEPVLGGRSTHFAAGIGGALGTGARLPLGHDPQTEVKLALVPSPRFSGGTLRVVPSLQTALFSDADIGRFEATVFQRDSRGNRMGVRLIPDGDGFQTSEGLTILSEVIVPGDIQITGDGTPFVLLSECQTTGGYPRIGSVLPSDMPKMAQTPIGADLRLSFVSLEDAVEIERRAAASEASYLKSAAPLVRDPRDIKDLLSYNLVGGVIDGGDALPW